MMIAASFLDHLISTQKDNSTEATSNQKQS